MCVCTNIHLSYAFCLHCVSSCTGCAGQRRQLCGPGAVSVLPLLYGLLNRAEPGGNKIQNVLNIKENLPKLRQSNDFFTSLFVICIKMQKRYKYRLINREISFLRRTEIYNLHALQRHCTEHSKQIYSQK